MRRNLLVVYDLLEGASRPGSFHAIYTNTLLHHLDTNREVTAHVTGETLNYVLSQFGPDYADWFQRLNRALRFPEGYVYPNARSPSDQTGSRQSFAWRELEAIEMRHANRYGLTLLCLNDQIYQQVNHPENGSNILTLAEFLNLEAVGAQMHQIVHLSPTHLADLPSPPTEAPAATEADFTLSAHSTEQVDPNLVNPDLATDLVSPDLASPDLLTAGLTPAEGEEVQFSQPHPPRQIHSSESKAADVPVSPPRFQRTGPTPFSPGADAWQILFFALSQVLLTYLLRRSLLNQRNLELQPSGQLAEEFSALLAPLLEFGVLAPLAEPLPMIQTTVAQPAGRSEVLPTVPQQVMPQRFSPERAMFSPPVAAAADTLMRPLNSLVDLPVVEPSETEALFIAANSGAPVAPPVALIEGPDLPSVPERPPVVTNLPAAGNDRPNRPLSPNQPPVPQPSAPPADPEPLPPDAGLSPIYWGWEQPAPVGQPEGESPSPPQVPSGGNLPDNSTGNPASSPTAPEEPVQPSPEPTPNGLQPLPEDPGVGLNPMRWIQLPDGQATVPIAVELPEQPDGIKNFGGVGRGVNPDLETVLDVDTLQFSGAGLTPERILLKQQGDDLEISFEDTELKVKLQNFQLDNLDNLSTETSASITIGNILFDGQTTIQDSFDVVDAELKITQVLRPNTVTFLNGLDNFTGGYADSDDVIDGLTGNDKLYGLSGNDKLRGGEGNDLLYGDDGDDYLLGGEGDDLLNAGTAEQGERLNGGAGSDLFVIRTDSKAMIEDFELGQDKLRFDEPGLSGAELDRLTLQVVGNDTLLFYDQRQFATLENTKLTSLDLGAVVG